MNHTTAIERFRAKFTDRRTNGKMLRAMIQYESAPIENFLQEELEGAYRAGQQNPLVGFLRQYLNEQSGVPDFAWTDEQILEFLRIPFKNTLQPNL